jgi:hypothetical protein
MQVSSVMVRIIGKSFGFILGVSGAVLRSL